MQKDQPLDKAPQSGPAPVRRNVDTEIRLDGEVDTLYDDGLEVDKEAGELAGTRGGTPGIAKP